METLLKMKTAALKILLKMKTAILKILLKMKTKSLRLLRTASATTPAIVSIGGPGLTPKAIVALSTLQQSSLNHVVKQQSLCNNKQVRLSLAIQVAKSLSNNKQVRL